MCKEKDKSNFLNELEEIRKFIESSPTGVDERSIVAGIAFQPSFVSVNIQRLKTLLNRCKSSINKGFQQINYVSEKSQVKSHLIKSIPLLNLYQSELRQWTIRIPNNGPNGFSRNFVQYHFSSQTTDIQNINLQKIKLQNDKPILPPIIRENHLLHPPVNENFILTNLINSTSSAILTDQNSTQKVSFNPSFFPTQIQPTKNIIINNDNDHSPSIQNPPEIRLCNSQCVDTTLSIDDFDISNNHELGMNEYDPYALYNCSDVNDNCSSVNNSFEIPSHFRIDEMYSDYYNHDDPQDDDIGLNSATDHNGSSIDIRNNFSS